MPAKKSAAKKTAAKKAPAKTRRAKPEVIVPGAQQVGTTHPAIKDLQVMLYDAGLYHGSIDGQYGNQTRNAVNGLQMMLVMEGRLPQNFPPDGSYNAATAEAAAEHFAEV